MLSRLVGLLAQVNMDRYNRGLRGFKMGLTITGVGIIIAALGIGLSKSKDPEKGTAPAVKWTAAGIVSLMGISLIAYAWLFW